MCNPLKKKLSPTKNVNVRKNSTNPPPPLHESILTTTATSKSLKLNLTLFQKISTPPETI